MPEETRTRTAFVKRLRGYNPGTGDAEYAWDEEQIVPVSAPLDSSGASAPAVCRMPATLTRQLLSELELKVARTSLQYDMEDDQWDGSGTWGGRGAILPSQGSSVTTRIGNKIIVRRLVCRGTIIDADTETNQVLYRLVIVRDTQRATVTMDANQLVFTDTEITASFNPSFVGPDKRFQVLSDESFNVQKRRSGPLRVSFAYSIDVEDEIATNAEDGMGFTPQYYLLSQYNDDTVHFVLPSIAYTWVTYFVDP